MTDPRKDDSAAKGLARGGLLQEASVAKLAGEDWSIGREFEEGLGGAMEDGQG